jgi:hypothetical protein
VNDDIPAAKPYKKGTYSKPLSTWEVHIKAVKMFTRLNCKGWGVMVVSRENDTF